MIFTTALCASPPELLFDDYFVDQTMRIDYFHIGDTDSEIITLDHIFQYGIWAGSRKNLLDAFNNGRYGGGGIYNSFCTVTVNTQFYEYIFIHEFGHSFTGLADEYYTSAVAYNDFYPKGVEPDITALLDPADLKWKQ